MIMTDKVTFVTKVFGSRVRLQIHRKEINEKKKFGVHC